MWYSHMKKALWNLCSVDKFDHQQSLKEILNQIWNVKKKKGNDIASFHWYSCQDSDE